MIDKLNEEELDILSDYIFKIFKTKMAQELKSVSDKIIDNSGDLKDKDPMDLTIDEKIAVAYDCGSLAMISMILKGLHESKLDVKMIKNLQQH